MQRNNLITDTITALSTAPGRGGIAIVRVSGPLVKKLTSEILGRDLHPREATLTPFLDEKGEAIDEGIALFFPHPHSFTGEDILELHGHGGPVVVDLVLQRLLSLGARLARPGEFSERAFLNGKLDLTQAEAIADLIDASSTHAARLSMRSLQGAFSKDIHALNEKIIGLRMYIEAAIDFSEEEIDFLNDASLMQTLTDIQQELSNIQRHAKQGSLLREGINVVIVGKPNVGKSSLLNALSGRDIAIVTDIPGTTRDVLRNHILIDDIPMHIIDTAGLRESDDVVEQEGIRRAHSEIDKADLLLYMTDEPSLPKTNLWDKKNLNCPVIVIRNKIDVAHENPFVTSHDNQTLVALSAKFGQGLDLLKAEIKKVIGYQQHEEGIYLARRRHLQALAQVNKSLQDAATALSASRAGELVAEDLRLAQLSLNEITGEFTADDLLGKIFSSFCIGK